MISDSILLEGLRQGDHASFEALFHRHYKRVYHLLFRLMGTHEEAEELTQEVFIKLYRKPLRKGANVSGWLYKVATNLGYNALRGNKRRTRREDVVMVDAPLTSPSASSEADRNLARERVRATLAQLKPRDGQLLLLRQMGLSYQELAEALNVSPNSIGTLLSRAERAFRQTHEKEA